MVYGLTSGVAVPTTSTGGSAATVPRLPVASWPRRPHAQHRPHRRRRQADTWRQTGASARRSCDLSGFAIPTAVPRRSILHVGEAADRLRHLERGPRPVGHRDTGGRCAVPRHDAQRVGPDGRHPTTVDLTSGPRGRGALERADRPGHPLQRVDAGGRNRAGRRVFLDLTYTPPTFRGEHDRRRAGQLPAGAYSGGSAGQCAVLSTETSYKGRFHVQGTLYTPIAPIDLTLNNFTPR